MSKHIASKINDLLAGFYHPELKEIDLSLSRMYRFMDLLGNPHERIPRVIHVAGTNGKGSLIAYIKSILNAAGLSTHVYTSPHLVKFNERIVVKDKEIADEYLLPILEKCKEVARIQPVTFFEITTAAAFIAFSQTQADFTLLEVGMGGRLDATNIIKNPSLTAITPISFDHMEFLGDTLEKIASEKAGIIKAGAECISGLQCEEALSVIDRKCDELNAAKFFHSKQWFLDGNLYSEKRKDGLRMEIPLPSLNGGHQYQNAATAIACISRLREIHNLNISVEHIKTGIQSAIWKARMQDISNTKLATPLCGKAKLYLDGGHNQSAAKVIAENISHGSIAIVGMLKGKDANSFIKELAKKISMLIAVDIPNESKCYRKEELEEIAINLKINLNVKTANNIKSAVALASDNIKNADVIICGSLYLAGEVLNECQ